MENMANGGRKANHGLRRRHHQANYINNFLSFRCFHFPFPAAVASVYFSAIFGTHFLSLSPGLPFEKKVFFSQFYLCKGKKNQKRKKNMCNNGAIVHTYIQIALMRDRVRMTATKQRKYWKTRKKCSWHTKSKINLIVCATLCTTVYYIYSVHTTAYSIVQFRHGTARSLALSLCKYIFSCSFVTIRFYLLQCRRHTHTPSPCLAMPSSIYYFVKISFSVQNILRSCATNRIEWLLFASVETTFDCILPVENWKNKQYCEKRERRTTTTMAWNYECWWTFICTLFCCKRREG